MKVCPQCEAENFDNNRLCKKCHFNFSGESKDTDSQAGHPRKSVTDLYQFTLEPEVSPKRPPTERNLDSRNTVNILKVILALIVLGGAIYAISSLWRSESNGTLRHEVA